MNFCFKGQVYHAWRSLHFSRLFWYFLTSGQISLTWSGFGDDKRIQLTTTSKDSLNLSRPIIWPAYPFRNFFMPMEENFLFHSSNHLVRPKNMFQEHFFSLPFNSIFFFLSFMLFAKYSKRFVKSATSILEKP